MENPKPLSYYMKNALEWFGFTTKPGEQVIPKSTVEAWLKDVSEQEQLIAEKDKTIADLREALEDLYNVSSDSSWAHVMAPPDAAARCKCKSCSQNKALELLSTLPKPQL